MKTRARILLITLAPAIIMGSFILAILLLLLAGMLRIAYENTYPLREEAFRTASGQPLAEQHATRLLGSIGMRAKRTLQFANNKGFSVYSKGRVTFAKRPFIWQFGIMGNPHDYLLKIDFEDDAHSIRRYAVIVEGQLLLEGLVSYSDTASFLLHDLQNLELRKIAGLRSIEMHGDCCNLPRGAHQALLVMQTFRGELLFAAADYALACNKDSVTNN